MKTFKRNVLQASLKLRAGRENHPNPFDILTRKFLIFVDAFAGDGQTECAEVAKANAHADFQEGR